MSFSTQRKGAERQEKRESRRRKRGGIEGKEMKIGQCERTERGRDMDVRFKPKGHNGKDEKNLKCYNASHIY